MKKMILSLAVMAGLFLSGGVQAADQAPKAKEPLVIDANRTLEWRRADRQYVATGQVVAKQGDVEIRADKMVADYRDASDKGGKSGIYQLIAQGHVIVTSGGSNQVFGDHAVYNLDDKKAVMTGENLKMQNPEQTVTAHDRFEYWTAEDRVNAIGQAKVVQAEDVLEAETISAWIGDDGKGARVMTRAEAEGGVKITTPREVVTGSSGVFLRETNVATLKGPVKITRGPNVLNGDRAEVNLTTNVSTLFADGKAGQRVRGIFYPGSEKADKSAPASAGAAPKFGP